MRPGVIGVPLDAKTDVEITLLANLISLTPGTLSLDVSATGTLYVHAMYVHDRDGARALGSSRVRAAAPGGDAMTRAASDCSPCGGGRARHHRGRGDVLALVRLALGPTLPDRVVALDVVANLAVGAIAASAVAFDEPALLQPALVVALIAFIGTVAFARYLERRRPS
jgi:multicomponent Na+:H+ antiporter subunit F